MNAHTFSCKCRCACALARAFVVVVVVVVVWWSVGRARCHFRRTTRSKSTTATAATNKHTVPHTQAIILLYHVQRMRIVVVRAAASVVRV